MTTDPADELDAEFPNLRKAVVDAWRNAPEGMRVEILDGELVMMQGARNRGRKISTSRCCRTSPQEL